MLRFIIKLRFPGPYKKASKIIKISESLSFKQQLESNKPVNNYWYYEFSKVGTFPGLLDTVHQPLSNVKKYITPAAVILSTFYPGKLPYHRMNKALSPSKM